MMKLISHFLLVSLTLTIFSPLALAQDPGIGSGFPFPDPQTTRPIEDFFEKIDPTDNSDESTTALPEGPASFGTATEQTGGTASLSWLLNVATNIARGIIDWITAIAGGVVVLMIIWGGILYIQGNTEAGKKTILAAVVGTVIILLAFFLVNVFKSIIGA